jgi:ATP-binding cassette subfamily B protein
MKYNNVDSLAIGWMIGKIGFVTQDTQLFSGTIRRTLFVRPDWMKECMAVLKQATCESLLAKSRTWFKYWSGEGGVKVSGGRKNSVYREVLWGSLIFWFDEATSSLDSITEEEITETY